MSTLILDIFAFDGKVQADGEILGFTFPPPACLPGHVRTCEKLSGLVAEAAQPLKVVHLHVKTPEAAFVAARVKERVWKGIRVGDEAHVWDVAGPFSIVATENGSGVDFRIRKPTG